MEGGEYNMVVLGKSTYTAREGYYLMEEFKQFTDLTDLQLRPVYGSIYELTDGDTVYIRDRKSVIYGTIRFFMALVNK